MGLPTPTDLALSNWEPHNNVPILWTLSEPYGAKVWWPCKQDLNDKIDSVDIFISTPKAYKAASNGILVAEQDNGTHQTFHWRHRHPITAYLIAIAVTNYATYTEQALLPDGTSVPVVNYVYPEDFSRAQNELSWTKTALEFFSERFGVYPFADEKYGHAQFGWAGGMEHQTMSFMGSYNVDLQSHELAHQWFGNLVTCGSWTDIWLNEGFATYLTALTYEAFNTPEEWLGWKRVVLNNIISANDGSVFRPDTTDVGQIFNSRLAYRKGAFVLHMLRWELGDNAFFEGIRNYLNDPQLRNGYARTSDLQNHLEQASGADLEEFMEDWFYGEGHPSYRIVWEWVDDELILRINQSTSHPSVDFFEATLPIQVMTSTTDSLLRVRNNQDKSDHPNPIFTRSHLPGF